MSNDITVGERPARLAAFREEARRWLAANVPKEQAPSEGPASREFVLRWQQCQHQGGWAGLTWPKEYGGRALSAIEQIVWFEEYAAAQAPSTHDASFVGMNHAGPTLIACGSEAQKAFHLPKILRGEVIWCQGFSEPGSGSDLASLRTSGRVVEDEIVVTGHKIWSSYADLGDYQELLIRTDPRSSRHHGLSWVICPMNAPGITVRPIRTMAGPRKFAEVFYDEVRLPIDNVVGGLGNGWRTAMSTLGFERGTASLALQIRLVYKVEELIARCNDPVLAARLADLRAEAAALRAMTYRFALTIEHGAPGSEGSMIRLYFAELAQRVADAAIDLYGIAAVEVLEDHAWGFEYLDGFSETIAGGTAEIQRNIIGERVLGLPRGAR
jgi:alkylation response protein AidB-like acyl-CoA dehydrogenase